MFVRSVVTATAAVAAIALSISGCSSSDTSSSASEQGAQSDDTSIGFTPFTSAASTGDAIGQNALSIITTGYPDVTSSCNGKVGANPVVVVNNTDEEQWFNVTDNTDLANNLAFYSLQSGASMSCANNSTLQDGNAYSVAPGESIAVGMAAGGYSGPDTSITGQGHNLSIGGGKSGNTQWYDLWLALSGTHAFESWELGYSGTGGLDASQNTQAGLFNAVQCSADTSQAGSATITVSDTIITSNGANQNAYNYVSGDPICFGFFNSDAQVAYTK